MPISREAPDATAGNRARGRGGAPPTLTLGTHSTDPPADGTLAGSREAAAHVLR